MAIEFHDDEAGEDQDHAEPSMNTTPLIDVLLVLLVMLIITIPIQLHAVNLDMPVGAPPTSQIKPEKIQIDIDERSIVYWQGLPVTAQELDANMTKVSKATVQVASKSATTLTTSGTNTLAEEGSKGKTAKMAAIILTSPMSDRFRALASSNIFGSAHTAKWSNNFLPISALK